MPKVVCALRIVAIALRLKVVSQKLSVMDYYLKIKLLDKLLLPNEIIPAFFCIALSGTRPTDKEISIDQKLIQGLGLTVEGECNG